MNIIFIIATGMTKRRNKTYFLHTTATYNHNTIKIIATESPPKSMYLTQDCIHKLLHFYKKTEAIFKGFSLVK